MNVNEMDRDELLMELSNYQFVPRHGPNYEKMSDDELRIWLERFREMFREAFKEE